MKVLIVEDDPQVAEMSTSNAVDVANDGADGSFMARSYEYDAIVLDYSLPKKNSLIVCEEIRKSGKTTPILFLSSTDDEVTKIQAFEKGADDYITKPFSLGELQARLRAVTRRPKEIKKTLLTLHDLVMDTDKLTVRRGDTDIHLTLKEFCLLEYLMSHPRTLLSRTMLMEHVWSADNDPFSNTLEAHIRNVRRKINANNAPEMIRNIPGRGYIIDEPQNIESKDD